MWKKYNINKKVWNKTQYRIFNYGSKISTNLMPDPDPVLPGIMDPDPFSGHYIAVKKTLRNYRNSRCAYPNKIFSSNNLRQVCFRALKIIWFWENQKLSRCREVPFKYKNSYLFVHILPWLKIRLKIVHFSILDLVACEAISTQKHSSIISDNNWMKF